MEKRFNLKVNDKLIVGRLQKLKKYKFADPFVKPFNHMSLNSLDYNKML